MVRSLENYCEVIYTFHEQILNDISLPQSNDYVNNMYAVLSEQLSDIKEALDNDIKPRREIIFLTYKPSKRDYMEVEWKKACAKKNTDVYVIPIPYYYKNSLGGIESEHYDVEGYPDYVDAIDCHLYDFEKRLPDTIYIQLPYDNDNYTVTVDPYYYSSNLKKYTDELIYVPCFTQEEFGMSDERAYKVMRHYVISPGVVYSDKVIVQSEQMKGMYVNKLVEFFGEDTATIWESKIESRPEDYEVVLSKKSLECIDIPDEWKNVMIRADGSAKKVMLYNVGVDGLMEHGDKMLEKIKSSLDIFKNNSDNIALI